jgi:hypothetical protein
MGKRLSVIITTTLTASLFVIPAHSAVKAGSSCKKLGSINLTSTKKFTCIKLGKKLVWNKGVILNVLPSKIDSTPTPTPTPTPTFVDFTFKNLFEKRSNISFTAWKRSNEIFLTNKPKEIKLQVFTGPNTKPFYEKIDIAITKVSRLFPSKAEPQEVVAIRYVYKDLEWAENIGKTVLTPQDYEQLVTWERGKITKGNCEVSAKNCRGSRQMTTPSGVSVILLGVENQIPTEPNGYTRLTTGMLEAHEYFHSLQRIPIINRGIDVWPHAWFREGGAEWVQNIAIHAEDYGKYTAYIREDCAYTCRKMTVEEIDEFLTYAVDNYLPKNFDPWLNYSLGSHVIEILVALKGPEVLVDMYAEMGNRLSFDDAFKKIFNVTWTEAIPEISRTLHANLLSSR